ncbi:MAG: thioesterase family protein [Alistipes sp.]|nr:thioesterase family protein [Alistipes sp.]MBO7195333.1 thioesterase family protein [Alistipes sp.]
MLEIGLKYQSRVVVSLDNTALTLGSGDMEVFATPAMIALMENAAMNSVVEHLDAGATTVGTMMKSSHIKASPVGAEITAEAELVAVEGRRLTFAVKAWDEKGVIGEGEHERFIVDKTRFLAKL